MTDEFVVSWPSEATWEKIQTLERPFALNEFGLELNRLIMPNIGDPQTDLRSLSLREWTVEFIWVIKQNCEDLSAAKKLINYGIKSIKLLMEEKTVTKLVRDIQSNFDFNGNLASYSEVIAPFFADTLVKHYNLWRYVLVQDREVSVSSHEVGVMSLNSTICDNISLNLAMPKEYLNPPVPEQSDDGSESACEKDADNEILTTASVSRVAAVFDQVTESMILEAQNQAMQLIKKTENELNEKFLKT